MRVIGLCAALLGCAASSQRDAPTCKDAVERMTRTVTTPAEQATSLIGRCEQQAWAVETRRCVAGAASSAAATSCVSSHEIAGTQPAERTGAERPRDAAEGPRDEAERLAAQAERLAAQAVKDAEEAREKVEQIAKDLHEMNAKLERAVDAVAAAQNDADRASAKAKLEALRREQAELNAKVRAAKDAAGRAQPDKARRVSPECLDHPLAEGCS